MATNFDEMTMHNHHPSLQVMLDKDTIMIVHEKVNWAELEYYVEAIRLIVSTWTHWWTNMGTLWP